eukprot:COSAG02_NODE_22571_length_747_cov_14.310185_2_plen_76_part_01
MQELPSLYSPATQSTQDARSSCGCLPTPHIWHGAPVAEKYPAPMSEQGRHAVRSAFGFVPGSHGEHATPSVLTELS